MSQIISGWFWMMIQCSPRFIFTTMSEDILTPSQEASTGDNEVSQGCYLLQWILRQSLLSLRCFITRECNTRSRSQFWIAMHKEPPANPHSHPYFLSWKVSSRQALTNGQDIEVQLWQVGDTAFPISGFWLAPTLTTSRITFLIWLIVPMSNGQYIHADGGQIKIRVHLNL